jgi:hypothetical protein
LVTDVLAQELTPASATASKIKWVIVFINRAVVLPCLQALCPTQFKDATRALALYERTSTTIPICLATALSLGIFPDVSIFAQALCSGC